MRHLLAVILAVSVGSASALEAVPADTAATLTLDFAWKAREDVGGDAPGYLITDRRTRVVCDLIAGEPTSQSVLDGATAEQAAAMAELETATRAELEAIPDESIATMQDMERRMSDCRKRGRSDQECAMEMVAAMQSDPALLESMDAVAGRDTRATDAAQARVEAAAGRIQGWYLEGCRGTMTVADVSALDDLTTPGIDPPVHTTGTVEFDAGEDLMLIETDLARGSTSFVLNTPRAHGFRRDTSQPVGATGMPVGQVRIGPRPGPLADGRHEFTVKGGAASVQWRFARATPGR
jgi:hypothetical protein